MCDLQYKLVAWLDGELSAEESASVKLHVLACEDCRRLSALDRAISDDFIAYCSAVLAAKSKPATSRWTSTLAGVAAVIAAVVWLSLPRAGAPPPPPVFAAPVFAAPVALNVAPPAAPKSPAPPRKAVHNRRPAPTAKPRPVSWRPAETTVQIAIPADEMFAPGAVPPGVKFLADVSFAPDGSVVQVRLRQ